MATTDGVDVIPVARTTGRIAPMVVVKVMDSAGGIDIVDTVAPMVARRAVVAVTNWVDLAVVDLVLAIALAHFDPTRSGRKVTPVP